MESELLKLNPSDPLKVHTDQKEKGIKKKSIILETKSYKTIWMLTGWESSPVL